MQISEGQRDKLNKAFQPHCESITIRRTVTDLRGEDVIAITKSQLDRLVKANDAKKVMTIKMSKTMGLHHEN